MSGHGWRKTLPSGHPFRVFVDIYVVLEMILVGHTNVQAATMEHNYKLKLGTDKALLLKTFQNNLPTLFGRPTSDGTAVKMVMSTKDSFLPGITGFEHWETANRMGGVKIVLRDQI
eukprot:2084313-Ditylum_brightwellii.AAC.1